MHILNVAIPINFGITDCFNCLP